MILTVDLGTSATKVALWGDKGLVALGRAVLDSTYSADGRVEQDPRSWWSSVVAALAACAADAAVGRTASTGRTPSTGRTASAALAGVEAVGFAAARQTFVPCAVGGEPLGAALVWSDRRAGAEAAALAAACGGADDVRRRTGLVLDAASPAAKVAWLAHHEPGRLRGARWLLSPRDLVAWRLTGEVCTDPTMASATGLYDTTGNTGPDGIGPPVATLVGEAADLLPEVRPSDAVAGALSAGAAAELSLPVGIPVVIGAGDRACEVLGAGASVDRPMVSWGTTANVSVPVDDRPDPAPDAMVVTRGALGGWLLEGGLSAAGSLVDWLARFTGLEVVELMQQARTSPPGSRGVTALPWFGGARAPWWRDGARGAVTGLSLDHEPGDVARAVVESVAWDVARCLESAGGSASGIGVAPVGLALGGGGATLALWVEILTAVTGLPARRRRSGEAASAGAAMIVAAATHAPFDLDRMDPVVTETSPDPDATAVYRSLRPSADAAARVVIGLEAGPEREPGTGSPRGGR